MDVPAVIPLPEDPSGLIAEQDEQQTSASAHEDAIPQCHIPDALPAVDHISDELKYNKKAVSLVSPKALSETPDEWDDLESEASPPSSVLSVSGREDLISHAELIRQMAVEADQLCIQLEANRKQALEEGRIKEAFLLRHQIEDTKIMSRRLHERAERRYYCGG
jgi:hypothetical protein